MTSVEDGTPIGGRLLAHKRAGALIDDVELTPTADTAMKIGTLGASNLVFDQLRKSWGGLWVGGDLDVFEDRLVFTPNAINRAIQTGNLSREVALTAITKVAWRFGIVTGIIDVFYANHCLSVRCYGSKALAKTIEDAVLARR